MKCLPQSKSESEIRELFGRYGDVIEIDPHTTDPTVLYVVSSVVEKLLTLGSFICAILGVSSLVPSLFMDTQRISGSAPQTRGQAVLTFHV